VQPAPRGSPAEICPTPSLDLPKMVSTVLVNSVDNVSKKVFTVGLAAETTRRMVVIRWQIVPLRDRVRRGGAAGAQRAAGRPRSPGSVSGRGSTTDGHLAQLSDALRRYSSPPRDALRRYSSPPPGPRPSARQGHPIATTTVDSRAAMRTPTVASSLRLSWLRRQLCRLVA
jgi:hypothetical protein